MRKNNRSSVALVRQTTVWPAAGACATHHVAFVALTGRAYRMGEVGRLEPGADIDAPRPRPDGPVALRGDRPWE
jgi:hypothetical protein